MINASYVNHHVNIHWHDLFVNGWHVQIGASTEV